MFALLKNSAGFLLNKGRQLAAEKLTDGDVTNQKLRSVIVDKLYDLSCKIDAFAQGDLRTSVSFFKEGLVFLKDALSTEISETDRRAEGRETRTPQTLPGVITTVVDNLPVLVKKLRDLNLADLDESCKKALLNAEKKLDNANCKAAAAFHNDTLTPSDRIVSMALRLMATILAKTAENLGSVLEVCRSNLEELHSAAIVQENFKTEFTKSLKVKRKLYKGERREIIFLVYHINRIIFDITLLIGETKELFLLPCIDIGNERVDPLRDARVAKILRKVDMSDLSLIRSFGEKKGNKVSSIYGVASNTSQQFLVARHIEDDFSVDVFDSNGDFFRDFGLPSTENEFNRIKRAGAIATDEDDNIYVLTVYNEDPMTTEISVFDKTNSSERKVFEEKEFEASTFILKGNHLLVPGRLDPGSSSVTLDDDLSGYVLMYNTDGKRLGDFSEKGIGRLLDITADDNGNVMVLNDTNCVYVFALITANNGVDDPGQDHASNSDLARFLKKFEVAPSARAIAFHWPTGNLVIASSTLTDVGRRSRVFLYSMEGNLERSIDIKLEDTENIQAAIVSSDGSICVATKSKVLVL
ncbi:PREDICTED: uncharacterized protein LOC107350042 [Acropora digitifera]|uniref:uncharacterized protein LOC107350042 n=1 Tax=Acropora digitifera TaxID=70779 RepID=UPI00077A096E|nr:PREDICTED: uncharacterized protein LOC107350042 [Acropora digitifera]